MPLPIELAHALAKRLELVRRSNELQYLLPDGKTQVTVEYDGQDRPCRVAAVIVSSQHREGVDIHTLRDDILGHVILPTIPSALIDKDTQFFINPTGRFVMGGPAADSGVTGRKSISDTYGGCARHGGGSFPGRMPPRLTGAGRILPGTLRRTSSPPIWPTGVKCSLPMPSDWRSRCPSGSIPSARNG